MSSQIDPKTARTVHSIIRFPAILILAIFWFGIATPVFLVRFLAVIIFNLFRMAVQNYDTSSSSEPMKGLVYFSALYPTITGRLFRSVWIWNPDNEEERPTGLHFWAELVFFGITALVITFVNYRKDIFSGFFINIGNSVTVSPDSGPISWVVALFAVCAAATVVGLTMRDCRENIVFQVLTGLTLITSGVILYFSAFGWP